MRIENPSGPYLQISNEKLEAGVYFLVLERNGNTLSTGKMVIVNH